MAAALNSLAILSFVLPFTVAFLLHGSTTRHCVANTCYVECTTSLCQTRQGSIIFHPNRMSSVVILSAVSDKTNGNKPEKDNATPIVVNGVTLKMAFDSSTTWGVADLLHHPNHLIWSIDYGVNPVPSLWDEGLSSETIVH